MSQINDYRLTLICIGNYDIADIKIIMAKDWIELAKALASKTAVTEVDNAYTEKMEQLSLP